MKLRILFCFFVSGILGCGAVNTARPLKEGQHAVGLTFGGATIEQGVSATAENPEGGTMLVPLPNAILEGRYGLKPINGHDVDIQYGLNLTGLAFEHIGLQGGGHISNHGSRRVHARMVGEQSLVFL